MSCNSSKSLTQKDNEMKLKENEQAPNFITKDVYGKAINLEDYRGKKVLLMFNRNVGCPICNLQYNSLSQKADYFKENGVVVLSVYESTTENMKAYLDGETTFSTMIPNPDLSLYKLYGVERNIGKVMKGMLNGAIGKIKKGKTFFSEKIKQDGNKDRINAEFFIDENGLIKKVHYGAFIGDHLSFEEIKQYLSASE